MPYTESGAKEESRDQKSSESSQGIDNTTLFVRSLPDSATSESLSDFFSNISPVKHSVVVTDKETKRSKGFGFVTFALPLDAKKALEEGRKAKFEDQLLKIDYAKKRQRKQPTEDEQPKEVDPVKLGRENHQRPRLIIRNMPWSIRTPEQLEKIFSQYGKVIDATIPRRDGGKMSGFAFITLRKWSSAERAVKEANGMTIGGRQVAVDYSVNKNTWKEHLENGGELNLDRRDDSSSESEQENENEEAENEVDSDMDVGDDEEEDEGEEFKEDDEDDEDDEDEDEYASELAIIKSENRKNTTDENTVFIRNLSYLSTKEILEEHFTTNFGPVKYALPVIDKELEQPRGTGFVCFKDNASFEKCLESAPKQVDESSILIADDVDQRYVLNDRVLLISRAVNRERAGKLAESNAVKRQLAMGKDGNAGKDKRHLFLLNEGRITPESPLGQMMSKSDHDVRQQSLALRRQQLRSNPSLHLSLTRLAVRNIPRSVTAAHLKLLARMAVVKFAEEVKQEKRPKLTKDELERSRIHDEEMGAKEKKKKHGIVKQVKIITESKDAKTGRSRGYGFIEYSSHRLALMGLRWLNARDIGPRDIEKLDKELNKNAKRVKEKEDVMPKKKSSVINEKEDLRTRRLVVEFAIENIEVIKRRSVREKRAKERAQNRDEKVEPENMINKTVQRKEQKKGKKRKFNSGTKKNFSKKIRSS
ncbi:hypothetical protein V1511DRAFT_502090 [Dipodascopsis uninucleata]